MPERTNKLAPQLSTLLDAATTLNTASTRINTILESVETQLVQANIGLEVWLDEIGDPRVTVRRWTDHRGEGPTPTESETYLGFARVDKGWHLVLRENHYERD